MTTGIKCHICGMLYENDQFRKEQDPWGIVLGPLYWVNPKISRHTDEVLYFCGAPHAADWYESVRPDLVPDDQIAKSDE